MGLKEEINKPEPTELHSNGMGEVSGADGSLPGDVGLSMEARKQIENNRQYIAKYTSSHIGNSFVPASLRRYKPRKASKLRIAERDPVQAERRQEMNAGGSIGTTPPSVPGPKPGFREPPTRSFNPYK